MEMQFFVKPGEGVDWFERWRGLRMAWHRELGLTPEKLRWHEHTGSELAHYARAAYDIEYEFPFGWSEIEGIHNRGDFDLTRHQEHSGKKLEDFAQAAKTRSLPPMVETSAAAAGGAPRHAHCAPRPRLAPRPPGARSAASAAAHRGSRAEEGPGPSSGPTLG